MMNRIMFEVFDVSGNEVTVEVTFRLDTVELQCHGRSRAVFDRDVLRDWLGRPEGVLAVDDITLSTLDGRLGMAIDSLVPWGVLSPLVLIALSERI
jgi:hypothetical protein